MKVILLLAGAYANGGAYLDAGATPTIGDAAHEITDDRAKDIEKAGGGEIAEVEDADDDGLDTFSVAELKQHAIDEQIDLGAAKSKADILAAIRAQRG